MLQVPALFKWGGRKDETSPARSTAASETTATSKVLPRLLAALQQRPAPVLMDLGPVIGSNISFFGEQLGCKIFVEDLYAELERLLKAGRRETLAAELPARIDRAAASLDGIFCWDLFDYLDRATGAALAARLVPLLRPGGVLYGFFGQTTRDLTTYTRYVVDSPDGYRLRAVPATPTTRTIILNRDLNKMFQGLVVADSVLLKNSARETLFRKPS